MSPAQATLLPTDIGVRCEAGEFAKALRIITPFAQGALPSYSGVKLTADAGRLTLEATNGDQKVVTSLAVGVQSEGEVVVPAKVLDGFVRSLTGAVELKLDGVHLTVAAGPTSMDLRIIENVEWPLFLDSDEAEIELTEVWPHIKRLLWAEGPTDDKSAPAHCLHFDPNGIVVINGRALAVWRVPGLSKQTVNIPLSFMSSVTKAAEGEVFAQLAERLVTFRSGPTSWSSRTVTDAYPEWQNFVRAERSKTLTVGKAALLASLARTGLLPEESGFRRITMHRDGDELVLNATGPDVGTITDVIGCDGTYAEGDVMLRIDQLKNMTNAVEGDEITFDLIDPFHLVMAFEDQWVGGIMPLRPSVTAAAAPPSTAYPTSSKTDDDEPDPDEQTF